MNEEIIFYPPRRAGMIFQFSVILMLTVFSSFGLWQTAQASVGPIFLLYLLPSLCAISLVPWVIYRTYASYRSSYALQRDGIRLQWGWRMEDIPMDAILWVRRVGDLEFKLPLPWLRWPGAIIGMSRTNSGERIECMATSTKVMIVICTTQRIYAISPHSPNHFIEIFQRYTELGSLTPLEAHSIYPSFLLARVWAERPARFLWLGGMILCLVLLVWVSLLIPKQPTILFGIHPDGSPGDPVPAVQMLLLPVMSAFFYVTDLLFGLFFYRRADRLGAEAITWRTMAYILWGSSVLTTLFFLGGVVFLTSGGGN